MTDNSLTVPAYDPAIGVVAPTEGGTVTIEIINGSVEILTREVLRRPCTANY
ncbi:hypothetical protein ABT008_25105 [Micromonospora sp. NPDC002389]|uniref:hypothetical protein n=1 Tax=Micromonospora sp. NPDC002389 TaxID=3154272 RepID=UPI00331CE61F